MTLTIAMRTPLPDGPDVLSRPAQAAFADLAAFAATHGQAADLTVSAASARLRLRDRSRRGAATAVFAFPPRPADRIGAGFSGHAALTLQALISDLEPAAPELRSALAGIPGPFDDWRFAWRSPGHIKIGWRAGLPDTVVVTATDLGTAIALARRVAPACLPPAPAPSAAVRIAVPPSSTLKCGMFDGTVPAADLDGLFRALEAWQAGMVAALACVPDPPASFPLHRITGAVPL